MTMAARMEKVSQALCDDNLFGQPIAFF
jgi:hypothetical protein